MMSTNIPSVKDTWFQHQVLTRIHGTPVFETLQVLTTEIKANAASVPTTLGGGLYGHLGLVVSDKKYASLANSSPWVTPVNPGPYTPPATGTGPQIEAGKDGWRGAQEVFALCQATEKALIAQVVESIDSIYLRALLDRTTGKYAANLRDVLTHLYDTYGTITPHQVWAKETAIRNMVFDLSMPIDSVFNAIDDLADLAEHAHSAWSHQQMMDLAYMVLVQQPSLQYDLRLWTDTPTINRTWPTMLKHFRAAQKSLSSHPTAGNMFHQANTVSTMADLVAQRLLDTMPTTPDAEPPVETINAAITTALAARDAALLAQMQEMMTRMSTGTDNTNSRRRNQRNNRGRGAAGGTERPNDTTAVNKNRNSLYCWTHGACAHSSTECNNQLPGHATTATFHNMQGGSTKNFQNVPTN